MMKKLTALLLCVAMLMVGVVAQAESGYVILKTFLSDSEQLGTGYSKEFDDTNTSKELTLLFDMTDNTICLLGDNQLGRYEGTLWHVEMSDIWLYLSVLCNREVWTATDNSLDAGYSYQILITTDEGAEPILVDTVTKAGQVADLIDDMVNEALGN